MGIVLNDDQARPPAVQPVPDPIIVAMEADGEDGQVERYATFGQHLLDVPGGWRGADTTDMPVRVVILRQLLEFRMIGLHKETAPVFLQHQAGTVAFDA